MRATLTLILALLTLAPMQAAEKPPLDVTAELGFANHFRQNRPFHITVDLSGARHEITGSLRVIAPNVVGGETLLDTPIALTPGAHKRWRLTVPPIVSKSIKIEMIERGGAVIYEQEFFGMPVAANTPLIVVVQDESASRFTLPHAANDSDAEGAWRAASVAADELPEDPIAYAGVSAILWRADKPKALNLAQADAILRWLKHDGLLVIAGGRAVPPDLSRGCRYEARWGEMESFDLRGFADAKLAPPLRPATMLARPRKTTWDRSSLPVSSIAIRPLVVEDARPRLAVGERQLLTEQTVGGGVIAQMAFDPQDLAAQGAPLGVDFWEQVFCLPEPSRSAWTAIDWLADIARDASRVRLSEAANYRVEPVWRIAWVFGLFFAGAFGLNFLLFRKSRRYEWAWLILLVASVGLFLYNRAFGRVGGFGPTRQVEITRSYGVAGEQMLLSFTETGLLAPNMRESRIATTHPQQMLLGFDSNQRRIVPDGEKQAYPVRLKAGAFNTCSSIAFDELPNNGITATWTQQSDAIQIHLVNKTKERLLNARVFPPIATMSTDGSDEFVISMPAKQLQQWMLGAVGMTTGAEKDCSCPPRVGAYARNYTTRRSGVFGFVSYSTTVAMPVPINPEDEGIEQSHLLFRFELPETSAPLTATDANEVRCVRTVTLFIPVPATLDGVRPDPPERPGPPEKTYSRKERFQ
ncbi:MAG: hypothetical protein EXS18_03005 [Verrucomicrobiae bacterium]|nr:hypothetical protein [Verrucomicrobiae bacterium]